MYTYWCCTNVNTIHCIELATGVGFALEYKLITAKDKIINQCSANLIKSVLLKSSFHIVYRRDHSILTVFIIFIKLNLLGSTKACLLLKLNAKNFYCRNLSKRSPPYSQTCTHACTLKMDIVALVTNNVGCFRCDCNWGGGHGNKIRIRLGY